MEILVYIDNNLEGSRTIKQLFEPFLSDKLCIKVVISEVCDKRMLPWAHKRAITDKFVVENFDYFIYLEEDIIFSEENLTYFIDYRSKLRESGLVPGFHRVEFSGSASLVFATDITYRAKFYETSSVWIDHCQFKCLEECYCAMFILDKELALEYINSPSFAFETFPYPEMKFGEPEKSALAISFENIPYGFSRRVALPFNPKTKIPLRMCWVHHAPDTYTKDPLSPFGKIPVADMFVDA